MSPDNEKRLGHRRSDASHNVPHVVDFEGMHAGHTDHIRSNGSKNPFYGRREPQIP